MSATIVEPAPAKLNLALHVRRRRLDGFHDIETVFAFCRSGDTVTMATADTDRFAITGPFAASLSDDRGNLVLAARDAFAARGVPLPPLAITLDKKLPVASGIGGGSADAAATLRALARLSGMATDAPELVAIADTLGSDVPACLFGRTTFGSGRGEALQTAASVAGMPVLLVNPGVALSTAQVFAGWEGVDHGALDDWRDGRNDLEAPARAIAPSVGDVLDVLRRQPGTTLVRMSGSGATCFALFVDPAARTAAARAVAAECPDWWLLESALT